MSVVVLWSHETALSQWNDELKSFYFWSLLYIYIYACSKNLRCTFLKFNGEEEKQHYLQFVLLDALQHLTYTPRTNAVKLVKLRWKLLCLSWSQKKSKANRKSFWSKIKYLFKTLPLFKQNLKAMFSFVVFLFIHLFWIFFSTSVSVGLFEQK